MRVFVTGATGYIGSVVVEKLSGSGHDVVALARSDESEEDLRTRGIEVARGDLRDAESLVDPCRAADAVIHLAATGGDDWRTVDEGAVDRILSTLEGTNKPLVYTSGIWVMGDTGDVLADEEFQGEPLEMVAWRLEVEASVRGAADRDVRAAVVRPGIVYGRGGGILAMMVDEARRDGRVRVVGDGRQVWPVVHVDALAELYVRMLQAERGALYNAATGPSYAERDLALGAGLAVGGGVEVVEWPLEEARQEMGAFADARALSQRVSGARARDELGWAPSGPTPLEELVRGSYRVER